VEVVISGSSGLVGKALCAQLPRFKHGVTRLLRFGPENSSDTPPDEGRLAAWDPEAGLLDPTVLAGQDAIINLNGSNIAGQRWTAAYKQELMDSRVKPTRLLADTLAALPASERPRLFVSCSAIGYYGTHPATATQAEDAPSGQGFLAEICRNWEAAAEPAARAGMRVVLLRLGIVLAADGGPLAQIVGAFNRGLAGVIGNGRQMMSWVSIQDLPAALNHIMLLEQTEGPVNVVAPHPVSNAEMTRAVAEVIGKRVGPSVPPFAARLLMGEMADELLLAGQHVVPRKLLDSGFSFQHSELLPTLRALLRGA
jgi:uncharacterized protein (TIGR01777 family)